MTLLDHVVLQVDDLNAIGDWYDQLVSLAGGAHLRFTDPDRVRPTRPASPAVLLPGDRPRWSPTHLALRVENEATVRRVHEFATAFGAEIVHEPRLWPEYAPNYYAVFISDRAGNNLELTCQASTAQPTLSTRPITLARPSRPTNPETTKEHTS
jgi:catechol 2,3-dioxygenase-like lactoylglutathione lyase family enzyme